MPKTTDQRLDHIESEIAGLKADVGDLKGEMKEVRATLAQVLQFLARIDGRLDEQRSTLNPLIPTRLAAVPSAA